jgi:hypothetical protein
MLSAKKKPVRDFDRSLGLEPAITAETHLSLSNRPSAFFDNAAIIKQASVTNKDFMKVKNQLVKQ